MNGAIELSAEQLERYSRQILVPNFGGRGQQLLLRTAVAVYGVGLLPERLALGLARSGTGYVNVSKSVAERIAPRIGPDTRLVTDPTPHDSLLSMPLSIDAGLTVKEWHRCVEPAARAHNFALWSRALGSVGLVGVTVADKLPTLCAGWFFDFLPKDPSPSMYESCAIEWSAAWTSALALRHLANPSQTGGTVLYRYEAKTGTISAFLVPENFRCEHRDRE